jgi:hypothetical protein
MDMNNPKSMKGIYGAEYKQDGQYIEVTKKDGKVFFIPVEDVRRLNRFLLLNERIREMEFELNTLQ